MREDSCWYRENDIVRRLSELINILRKGYFNPQELSSLGIDHILSISHLHPTRFPLIKTVNPYRDNKRPCIK